MRITSTTWNGYINEAVSDDGLTTMRMGDTDSDYRLVTPDGKTEEKGVWTVAMNPLNAEIKAHNAILDAAKVEANKGTEALRNQLKSSYRKYACGERET